MRLGFKVVGVPEVAGALDRMGDQMGGQRLVDATMSGAGLLVNSWKLYIRQRAYKTGTYMRSIHAKVTHREPGFVQVTVGTDIVKPPYPFFLEYGTSKMHPRPTARPAFDENKDKVAQEIHDALGDLIDKEWR